MFRSSLTRTSTLRTSIPKLFTKTITPQIRALSIIPNTVAAIIPNSSIPKHEMVYFPKITTTLPESSTSFRKVLYAGLYSQVVIMTVPVGGDIGDEVHTVDQALTFTHGKGLAIINGKEQAVEAGDLMVVPAGTQHQFLNKGEKPLILYTIYSPAEHAPTTEHVTKEKGDKEEDDGIDVAPEWARKSKKENEDAGLVKMSGKY
ncbi:hypothetical protein HYALB_00008095 [Hymenoscyphus albidus]|uniref:Cupin type-2 domain-containing protein n=1 Tax=Hymenoscyphus albidus TaxID=595503 RepID=A0A9N9Q1M8_9HELO|nr:hypothetical protein HYALB_00008095 [Hymenoscyphus albidus]